MAEIKPSKKMLTLREISEQYSFSLSSLRRWASERKSFPLYKVKNRIKVSIPEWESWLEGFHIKPDGGDKDG